MSSTKSYIFQADLMRVIAILGVLTIHLVYPVYARPDFLGGMAWWLSNLMVTLSRPSVPLFIMLSGYLMIPKQESTDATLVRTAKRLIFPLLFWFAMYVWWEMSFFVIPKTIVGVGTEVFSASMGHLYFLVILVGLYIMLPIIRTVVHHASAEVWRYTLWLSIIVGFLIGVIQYLVFPGSSLWSSFTIWLPYMGYFLLGYQLGKPESYHRWRAILGFVGAVLFTMIMAHFNLGLLSRNILTLWLSGTSYFDHFLSPNVMIMSVCLYQILMHETVFNHFFAQHKFLGFSIKQLAKASFATYIIHFMIMRSIDYQYYLGLDTFEGNLFLYLFTRYAINIALSFGLAMILIRLPIVKWTFGEK